MFSRAVGTIAALSVGTSAFLLPPGVSSTSAEDGISTIVDTRTQAIKLPCPDCVFASKDDDKAVESEEADDLFWVQGRATDVILNFTLSEDSRAVMLNDWQVYPITLETSDYPVVAEVTASVSLAEVKEHPEQANPLAVSGASIFVNEEVISDAGDKVVNIHYQVASLEGQPVSVDGAEIKLLEGGDGTLMLISVEGAPKAESVFDDLKFPPPPHPFEDAPKDCGMLPAALCKIKGIFKSKIEGFKQGLPHKFGGKGCGGGRQGPHRLPGHIKPHIDHFENPEDGHLEDGERPHHHGHPEDGERPEHHGPHSKPHPFGPHGMHGGHHGHHHGHHRFIHRFAKAFVSILIPIIAGITMGMFVSLIGMATGRLIAFLWIKFRRGGRRGYASVAQTEVESPSLEKGAVEIVAEEPLPRYEDAPAYEEKEQK